jgi:hypothetical protein
MLDRLDAFESRESGLGDRLERLAGRIGDEMKVQPRRQALNPSSKAAIRTQYAAKCCGYPGGTTMGRLPPNALCNVRPSIVKR